MSTSYPLVSIVLPVFNEEKYIEQCLQTLLQIDYPRESFEIITVDNGSTDGSLYIAQQYADKALIITDVNVGAVRNFGVKNSKGDILAFLDSDCLVPTSWLKYGTNKLQQDPNCVLGGNLYLRENPAWIEQNWLLDNPNTELVQKDLLGSCIMIHKDHFLKVHGFNEKITSGEDTEISIQLKKNNKNISIDRDFGVIHLGNPTTIKDFIKRQIWHSENYLVAWKSSLKDFIFWLIFMYISGICSLLLTLTSINPHLLISAALIIFPPSVLSLKRIIRSKIVLRSIFQVFSIWLIDNLYLIGRSIGLIKGVILPKKT